MPSIDAGFKDVQSTIVLKNGRSLKAESNSPSTIFAPVAGEAICAINSVCSRIGELSEEGNLGRHGITCTRRYTVFNGSIEKVAEPTVWATEMQSFPIGIDDAIGDILVSPHANGGRERGKNTKNLAKHQVEGNPDENQRDMESGINHV